MTQKKWDTPRLFPLREGTLAVSHGDTFGGGAAIAAAGCSTGSTPGSKEWGADCKNGNNASGSWPPFLGGECQQGFSATFKRSCNLGIIVF